jgi:protoheme IX farnesyltransferase
MTAADLTGTAAEGAARVPRRRAGVRAYVALTKPRIIELLLVTTIPAMVLAQKGLPPLGLVLATLAGGTLTAASANAFNCYCDRDIDARMRRTSRRPLAVDDGALDPRHALAFAWLLGVAGTVVLVVFAGWLAAALADAAIGFYVFVYTLGLKRRTTANIVIGGAAGCFPVLVGWAAVTGTVGWPAWVLALVVFLWTPPHFWSLAMRFREDYAAAGVPMLPSIAPAEVVARKMLVYSAATVVTSLLLVPAAGPVYAACAVALGGWLLLVAQRLRSALAAGRRTKPMVLFHVTNNYLCLLFVSVVVAVLVS